MQYKSLPDEKIKEIANQEFTRQSKAAHSVELPKYVAIAGQAGAGKTAASQMVRDELRQKGGSIHLDTDIMRETLPLYGKKPPAEETQRDAGKIVDELRVLAIENKFNIVEEGTFRDSKWVSSLIEERKSQGYEVELMAVATPPQQSLAGIYIRYEAEHKENIENPRLVPESFHQISVDGFNQTVRDNAEKFNRTRVTTRAGEILFDSEKTTIHKTAIEAVEKGQKPSDQHLISISKAWQQALDGAAQRGANPNYVKAIEKHMSDIEDQKKERIHEHALTNVPKNLEVLSQDSRFKNHTTDEILKVAYFRGFHEKANEFKGMEPNYTQFDETMSDRDIVKNHLPEVQGLEKYKPQEKVKAQDDGLSL
jgi:hypothetical protein